MQQTLANSSLAAAASTAVVQQVETPIEFDVPVFEGDIAASWLTWSQKDVYQARVFGFGAELTAAEGEGLRVGTDVFDRRNISPL